MNHHFTQPMQHFTRLPEAYHCDNFSPTCIQNTEVVHSINHNYSTQVTNSENTNNKTVTGKLL